MTSTISTQSLDKMLLDTLKAIHNRGAELYNQGEHSAAFRLYQGGLIVAKPFLAHRVKQQSAIEEGLDQVEKSNADPRLKAFRLHEVIEQIRNDLKDDRKKQIKKANPVEAAVGGEVSIEQRPADHIMVAFFPDKATIHLATVRTDSEGRFQCATTLPVGKYVVTFVGEGIPESYTTWSTSPVTIELKSGVNTLRFNLS